MATKSADYLKQYKTFTSARTRPEDYVKKYQNELGVDSVRTRVGDARAAIRSTEDVIRNAPAGVAGRTSGSLVSDAQRNALVQNEVAPLNEVLQTQTAGFGDAQDELRGLLDEAGSRAQMGYSADTEKAGTLMELYNAAKSKEDAAAEQKRWEKQFREQQRQFDKQLAESRAARAAAAAAANSFRPTIGGGGGGNTPKAVMTKKSDGSGGYAFANSKGKPISAASFAKATGQNIMDVFYSMGQSGDTYAAQVYNQLRADPLFGRGNKAYDKRIKSTYSPLFWGS